jgi:hypothetical protein
VFFSAILLLYIPGRSTVLEAIIIFIIREWIVMLVKVTAKFDSLSPQDSPIPDPAFLYSSSELTINFHFLNTICQYKTTP